MPSSPAPASAASSTEERRLVTALFCDLVGFTPLAERLDPEEVRELQAAYFGAMRQQVERLGGTVQKYAGDAVVAFFGAPIAQEDDAERAVLCGLAMQAAIRPVARLARDRWDADLAIRVGVNTGEVVSGVWEVGGRRDVDVTGDAVNTAARFQTAAEAGEVLVGPETYRLTRRKIDYGQRRDLTLKGKARPVPGWTALGVREEVVERWDERESPSGYPTPLVGRDQEMDRLLDAWKRTQGGTGQLVTLVGDPGMGKSRLTAELLERVTANGSAVRLLFGRCLSYGQEIGLWLVADLLRSLVGLREWDTLEQIGVTVDVTLRDLLAGCEEERQEEAVDVLREVLGLPPGGSLVASAEPQIRRQALIRSLKRVMEALAQHGPVLLVLEDLHWIDAASREVLEAIVREVPHWPILALATQRPGWTPPWAEWSWPERLTLRPLPEQDAARLAGAVLGGMRLSPELERYVFERGGGNPFFVEELLRALEETGGLTRREGQVHLVAHAAEKLPSTLTEVLLARLDRLEGQVKRLAQVGSVIGRSFAVRLLAEVVGREQAALELPLVALQEAEVVSPRKGLDLEYVFNHMAMREVAYHTLVQKRRTELHLQTARAIASLYPADEYVEIIAYHYSRTEEDAEAIPWLEKAGDRAARTYANEIAISSYQEARRRAGRLGADDRVLARLEEKLGKVLFTAGRYDGAIPVLDHAIEHYRRAEDLEGMGGATALLGMIHRARGTPEEGVALIEPMIELLQGRGPSPALASLHVTLSALSFLNGQYRRMLQTAERGGEIARAIGDERLLGEAEMRRGSALGMLGQVDEAYRVLKEALPLVEAGGDLTALFLNLNVLGVSAGRLGKMEQDRRYMEQALAVAERMGSPSFLCVSLGNLGRSLIALGQWQRARDVLERGVQLGGTMGWAPDVARPLEYLGQLALWEGDWDAASRHLEDALTVAEEVGDRLAREVVQALLAELDVLAGRAEEAIARLEPLVAAEDANLGELLPPLAWAYLSRDDEVSIRRAEEVAERAVVRGRGQPGYLVHTLLAKGMALIRRGRLDAAEQVLTEELELARSLPFPYLEARTLVQLGHLWRQRGDQDRARELLEEARAIFHRLGAHRIVERMDEIRG